MMRLTIATLVLAGAVSASSHDSISKRAHRNRSLVSADALADLASKDHIPHKIRFPGHHDLEDVPDGLEFDLKDEDDAHNAGKPAWFADGPPEDDDPTTWGYSEDYVYDNSTHEEEQLEARATASGIPAQRKQCLAWTNDLPGSMHLFQDKLLAVYNWGIWKPDEATKTGTRWIPMLHDYAQRDTFKSKMVNGNIGNGMILSVNEPNLKSQGNASPGTVAWLHQVYLNPLANKYGYQIYSPAPANGPSAWAWLDEFKKSHPNEWSKLTGVALHYYGTNAAAVTQYLDLAYSKYKKNVILTEYACHSFGSNTKCNDSQAQAFVKTIANFCMSKPWCKMHCLYGSFAYSSHAGINISNRVFNNKNTLSTLGHAFAYLA